MTLAVLIGEVSPPCEPGQIGGRNFLLSGTAGFQPALGAQGEQQAGWKPAIPETRG
jgi:hypothetical protein